MSETALVATHGPAVDNSSSTDHDAADAHIRLLGRCCRAGFAVIVVFFGLIVGWAALSPLESAAVTQGVVGAEGRRKAVQHVDGGIVDRIMVREGELVTQGQEVLTLDRTQPEAALQIYTAEVETLLALTARLEAEASGSGRIRFPDELRNKASDAGVAALLQSQSELFAARSQAIAGQIETLKASLRQAEVQSETYKAQQVSLQKQYELAQKELEPKQELYDKGLATRSPIFQLQRLATGILAQIEESNGQIQRLAHASAQIRSQIAQIKTDQALKVAQELEDARNKLTDARERQRVARDVLGRTSVKAPVTGYVLGLNVNTAGAVITKGERILEVVPSNGELVINARLPPIAAVDIEDGMRAELRLMSPHGRKLPLIEGKVRRRSVDVRADTQTAQPYFEIEISVDQDTLKANPELRLTPGTPVEVIVLTQSRTALAYLLDPVADLFRHGMREQ